MVRAFENVRMVGAIMHHGIGSAFVDSLEILGPLSPTSSGSRAVR